MLIVQYVLTSPKSILIILENAAEFRCLRVINTMLVTWIIPAKVATFAVTSIVLTIRRLQLFI